MVAVVPDPKSIRGFRTEAAFEAWLSKNHDKAKEVWLKIGKKGSSEASVTYAQALDVALCWGWIDGIKKTFDESCFLQRFTQRKSKSAWSQINQGHIARLVAAGRMTQHGQKHVDAAQADGRWAAAYAPIGRTTVETVPADLRAAIEASPKARATFRTLNRANLFALTYRVNNLKTAAGRARKIATLVAMLERGELIVP